VPATLAARAQVLSTGHGRKTDVHDAIAVALVAQHHRRLRSVQPEDLSSVIRLVSDHRDDLVHEHTSGLNRLHRLLRELIPGGAPTGTSSRQAAMLLAKVRPATATDTARKQLARDLIGGLRALEARIKTLTDQLATLVAQSGTSLTKVAGVGSVVAAKIIGHTGDGPGSPTLTTTPVSTAPPLSTPPAASPMTTKPSYRPLLDTEALSSHAGRSFTPVAGKTAQGQPAGGTHASSQTTGAQDPTTASAALSL
jgi:hypothetical protein